MADNKLELERYEMAKIIANNAPIGMEFDDSDFEWAAHNLQVEGYHKQSGWISVDERLPTEEEYRDEYEELIPLLVTEKDTIYPYRALYDGKTWGDGLTAITKITHWMPLPEPPKGEHNG